MIDIDAVRAFVEVARTQNVSVAAKNLYRTQSAISQRISALEAQVGQTLFVRSRNGMKLNRFGEEFLVVCGELNRSVTVIQDWMDAQKDEVRGHLRIRTVSSFMNYVFPKFLKGFLAKYPEVKITINVHTSKFIEEAVLEGSHDVGIIVGDPQHQALSETTLLENVVYMVCSKHHPLAKKKKITDADLAGVKFIWHSEKRSRTVMECVRLLGFSNIETAGDIFLSDMDTCKIFALNGLGVAFVSKNHMRKELADGTLVRVTDFKLNKPLKMILRKDQYQSRLTTTFVNEFVPFCKQIYK